MDPKEARCMWYDLPDGWRKKAVQRLNNLTKWDVYLYPPRGYGKKVLRSNVEIIDFYWKNPSCPLDAEHVNLEKPFKKDSMLCRSTVKLINVIKAIKSGNIDPNWDWKEELFKGLSSRKKKLAKCPADGNVSTIGVVSNGKVNKTKKPKSGKTVAAAFSPDDIMALEKLFLDTKAMPRKSQIDLWASDLNLNHVQVFRWFRQKFVARRMYENSLSMLENKSGNKSTKKSSIGRSGPRKLQRFDVVEAFEPPTLSYAAGEGFVIEYDNCEEDVAEEDIFTGVISIWDD